MSAAGGNGESAAGDESTDRSEVSLGITPFRGRTAARLAELTFYYDTSRYKGFERDLRRTAHRLGIEVIAISRAAGIWHGQLEPAAAVQLVGDEAACHELGALLGAKYHQDAVMIFTPTADGDDFYYTIGGIAAEDADAAITTLVEYGIEGGRYVDGNLEIGDADGSLARTAIALSQTLDRQLITTTGRLRFLQKGLDYEPQAKKG